MEQTFKVTGMHCRSCEMLIKDTLEENKVTVIEISHKTGIIKVKYDDKTINEKQIIAILLKEGYKLA